MTRRGFTLIEVLVALVVLEIGFVGVAGLLHLASSTLGRAEAVERAVATAEGVLDSLRHAGAVTTGAQPFDGGVVRWVVDGEGGVALHAETARADTLLTVRAPAPGR